MTSKIVSGAGWSLAVVGIALWLNGEAKVTSLTHAKVQLEEEIEILKKTNDGMEAANEALRNRKTPTDLPQPIVVVQEERPAPSKLEMAPSREPENNPDGEPEAQRSPQEIAEQERREQEREQRRQEWAGRREQMREQLTRSTQDRIDYLSQISTEGLAPEYVESHNRLIQALQEGDALIQQMGNEELSRDDRRNMYRGMRELSGEIDRLMKVEREILYSDLANSYGMDTDTSAEFIETLNGINDMTTTPRPSWGGRGGRVR